MSVLVILGTEKDYHVGIVKEKLSQIGTHAFVMDYMESSKVTFEVDTNGSMQLAIDRQPVNSPFLIWDRAKSIDGTLLGLDPRDRLSKMGSAEWFALYHTLCRVFPGRVVNSLKARPYMYKPYQQIVAAKLGLKCPRSVVSNDRAAILKFMDVEPDIIMKSLSGKPFRGSDAEDARLENALTMAISRKDVEIAGDDAFDVLPHFAQRQIHKEHELRVVVVQEQVHAFKIPSETHEYYATDWRRGNDKLNFIPVELDKCVADKLIQFNIEMGLFSGSFDLIVDKAGEYWFLECNQDGQ